MPLFGGNAGQFPVLTRRLQPPVRVYRIVSGQVWWTLLHWPWRQYRAAVATGTGAVIPPALVLLGASGVYVTDRASLRGCDSPSDFAWRLSLFAQAQQECHLFGCAVIRFDLPQPHCAAAVALAARNLTGVHGGGGQRMDAGGQC